MPKKPRRVARLIRTLQPQIDEALTFIDSLGTNNGEDYYEVAEVNDREHQIYKQSQYLLSIVFKTLGRNDLFRRIRKKHHPNDFDNDPKRTGRRANDRFCVLEEDTKSFNFRKEEPRSNDGMALFSLFWLGLKSPIKKIRELYRFEAESRYKVLLSRYDSVRGVLEMDEADQEKEDGKGLYGVYKVALLGIIAKRMNDSRTLESVQRNLTKWQQQSNRNGGWIADLRSNDLEPVGLANLETTALCILALA